MKQFIDKLISRLEEKRSKYEDLANGFNFDGWAQEERIYLAKEESYDNAISIVNQLAEEYKGGWVPCSERLPENISTVILQVKEIEKPTIGWYGNVEGWRLTEIDFVDLREFTVLAWMPLPSPYHPEK